MNTVELVVDEIPWRGRPRHNNHDLVGLRIAWQETELRIAVKRAGGIWGPRPRVWELSWDAVRALGIGHRVVSG